MIYLASPYSHPDPRVCEDRFDAACRATVELVQAGHVVFSPIVHGHPLVRYGLPSDWAFWKPHDQEFLRHCSEVVVLTLDGWQASVGVQAEVRIAQALGLSVSYVRPTPSLPTLAFVGPEPQL